MAEPSTVDLVASIVTREATRRRGDETSPYSWGTGLGVAPGHARETAAAVLEVLRRTGHLTSPARLAEFGRYAWVFGWVAGVVLAGTTGEYGWPWWVSLPVGSASFYGGLLAIGWAARRRPHLRSRP